MTGLTYLERGRPVTIVARWARADDMRSAATSLGLRLPPPPWGPRNVVIRREDGSLVCRPFRGLRRAHNVSQSGAIVERERPKDLDHTRQGKRTDGRDA